MRSSQLFWLIYLSISLGLITPLLVPSVEATEVWQKEMLEEKVAQLPPEYQKLAKDRMNEFLRDLRREAQNLSDNAREARLNRGNVQVEIARLNARIERSESPTEIAKLEEKKASLVVEFEDHIATDRRNVDALGQAKDEYEELIEHYIDELIAQWEEEKKRKG